MGMKYPTIEMILAKAALAADADAALLKKMREDPRVDSVESEKARPSDPSDDRETWWIYTKPGFCLDPGTHVRSADSISDLFKDYGNIAPCHCKECTGSITGAAPAAKSEKGFKGFDDPWKIMSPEDRREANRLQILALKAFPSSPKQKEIREKLNAILKRYGF